MKRTRESDLNIILFGWANYSREEISQCLFFTPIVHKIPLLLLHHRKAEFFRSWILSLAPLEFLIIELFAYLVSLHRESEEEKKEILIVFEGLCVCVCLKVELDMHKKVL